MSDRTSTARLVGAHLRVGFRASLLVAFLVTDQILTVVNLECREEEIALLMQQFHFQLGAFRYNHARLARHQAVLTTRINHHLAQLYDQLLRPVVSYLGTRRLLIAPHRMLHYVPFHALYDGTTYVVASHEVCYIPSAAVLQHCFASPKRAMKHTLLIGVADTAAPRLSWPLPCRQPLVFCTADE